MLLQFQVGLFEQEVFQEKLVRDERPMAAVNEDQFKEINFWRSRTMQHTAVHCSTMQHTADEEDYFFDNYQMAIRANLYWNLLQHTDTRCNTPQDNAQHKRALEPIWT